MAKLIGKPSAAEGFEATATRAKMTWRLVKSIFWLGSLLIWSLIIGWWWTGLPDWQTKNIAHYPIAFFKRNFWDWAPTAYYDPSQGWVDVNPRWAEAVQREILFEAVKDFVTKNNSRLLQIYVLSLLGIYGLAFLYFRRKSAKERAERKIRGMELVSPKEVSKTLKKTYGKGRIKITNKITLPAKLENRHGIVLGVQGAGKSVFLKNLVRQVRENAREDEKMIIFDLKGEYVSIFYQEGDLIFNPLDARSVKWHMLSDLNEVVECEDFAFTLVPPAEGGNENTKYFKDGAATVLGCVLAVFLKTEGRVQNYRVKEALFAPTAKILKHILKHPVGHKAQSYIANPTTPQAMGVHSSIIQDLRSIDILPDEGDFSFRRWLKEGKGVLFLTVPPAYMHRLAPLMGGVMSLMMKEVLTWPDDLNRRIWIVADEFGNLPRLSSLKEGITLGRSKGLCVWLGLQNLSQIARKYSEKERSEIFGNTVTKVVFRMDDPQDAKYLSDFLGEAEYEKPSESLSLGLREGREGMSLSRREEVRKVVLPTEIASLPDLQCFVKIAQASPCRDKIKFRKYKEVTEAFIRVPEEPIQEKKKDSASLEGNEEQNKGSTPETGPEPENASGPSSGAEPGSTPAPEPEADPESSPGPGSVPEQGEEKDVGASPRSPELEEPKNEKDSENEDGHRPELSISGDMDKGRGGLY